jgi:hypothetical protein
MDFTFYQFLSVSLYTEAERKITAALYVGEWSISDPSPKQKSYIISFRTMQILK